MRKSFFLLAVPLWAQEPLAVRDAVQIALRENKALAAASEDIEASSARVTQARSGTLPRLNYSESFARGDNPVFVFGSLLTQHQFAEPNFALGPLNRPDALNNFQSTVTLDQPVYDAGRTRHLVRQADLGRRVNVEEVRRIRLEVIAATARAYYDAVAAAGGLAAAEQAVRSAEADLRRAEDVRSAGMSTDADVLSIRVHLAAVTEQRIRRVADLDVARAALNDAMGLPLDTPHTLAATLSPAALPDLELDLLERSARVERPEARQARLAFNLAQSRSEAAHAGMLPQVGFHAAFEADRQRFVNRGGANWLAAVTFKWNVFNGGADKAAVEEAAHGERSAEASQARADSAVRLQVRRAWAEVRAAAQRIEVAQAAMAEAQESLRITQNRYAAGMNTVTDLLRNETAVLESQTRYLAAIHDQRVAATLLELAAGRLSPESEVLN
jgi:outer membrane protein